VSQPRVSAFGEEALLIELGSTIDVEVNARVHALASAIDQGALRIDGLGHTVPGYASLLVPFDPASTDPDALTMALRTLATETTAVPGDAGETVDIAVRYGGVDGPDLTGVAERTGLTEDAVIELHAGTAYHVFMLGFAPGFAYLGPLPVPLRLPRRSDPRLRVPAGSVAIAAAQTAVYPHVTAGGWHLLGRTDERLWDPDAPQPARLRPGDRVRFVPS
jgi:KipI family sensor histidine kinase inhibitor